MDERLICCLTCLYCIRNVKKIVFLALISLFYFLTRYIKICTNLFFSSHSNYFVKEKGKKDEIKMQNTLLLKVHPLNIEGS